MISMARNKIQPSRVCIERQQRRRSTGKFQLTLNSQLLTLNFPMTRYRCTACEINFSVDDDAPRCPQCLRRHGLVEAGDGATASRPRGSRKRLVVAGLLLLSLVGLVVAGALLLVRSQTDLPRPGQLALLDADDLRKTLRQRGVPEELAQTNPFDAGSAAIKLTAQDRALPPKERAVALARRVAAKLEGVQPELDGGHASGAGLLTPRRLLAALAGGKRPRVTSFELASLMVALLRQAGLQAVLALAHRVDAPMVSPDPTGAAGRYVAVVYRKLGQQRLAVLDPLRALPLPAWAGKGQDATMAGAGVADLELLDDASAAAHLLALGALRLGPGAAQQAYRQTQTALKAAAPSAGLRVARAVVLARSGGLQDGVAEARKAVALRDDAPRRSALAQLLMSHGEPAGAVTLLRAALKADARYWPAMLLLSLVQRDATKADELYQAALKLAPGAPRVLTIKAARAKARGQNKEAIAALRQVLARRPSEAVQVMLYQALRDDSQTQPARKLRQQLIRKARDPKQMTRLLKSLDAADKAMREPEPRPDTAAPPDPGVPQLRLPDVSLTK